MKKSYIDRIIKASEICGFKVVKSRNLCGEVYTSLVYSNAGLTRPFNPQEKIGDAMSLLISMGGTVIVNNKKSECFCYLESDYPENLVKGSVRGSWKSKPENREKNICNAILNLVLTKGKK